MVIDTSALLAVLLQEPTAARVARALESGSPHLLSAANLLETSMVIESRKGEARGRELDILLYRAAIEMVPVDQDQVEISRIAMAALRQGPPSGRAQLRRLLRLCAGEEPRPGAAVRPRIFRATSPAYRWRSCAASLPVMGAWRTAQGCAGWGAQRSQGRRRSRLRRTRARKPNLDEMGSGGESVPFRPGGRRPRSTAGKPGAGAGRGRRR